ncbi:diguanylate cyclase [Myxosarcina sp. GI1(2024)]
MALILLYTAFRLISSISKKLSFTFLKQLEFLYQQKKEQITEYKSSEIEIEQLNLALEREVEQKTATLNQSDRPSKNSSKNTKFKEKILNLTPNLLYIYDLDIGHYMYCNRFSGEIPNYFNNTNKKLNCSSLFNKLLHPLDTESIEQHYQNLMTLEDDDYLEIEYRIEDKQGKWHWLHNQDLVFERKPDGTPKQILGITQDITKNKETTLKLESSNLQLKQKILALETSNQQKIKLGKINEFLQACLTLEEVQKSLADLLGPLFPDTDGAVYLINNSKTFVEAIATWGTVNSELNFTTSECWALRRSNIHQSEPAFPSVYCHHIHVNPNNLCPTICFPMMAQGETLGLLYLSWKNLHNLAKATSQTDKQTNRTATQLTIKNVASNANRASVRKLGETVAQNLAMSLANLKLQETLRYQSLRDPLTGLYNRRYLEESLDREIERAQRKQHYIGIMILDIDRFKRFNDTYGHDAGDWVLRSISKYLREQTRQYDIACRYGGEELVAIMPEASLENTIFRAEGIREGIKNLNIVYEGQKLEGVTVSIGISCFPDDGIETRALLRAADKAMYQAKQQGRDRVARC